MFKPIIDSSDTYKEIVKFFAIVEELFEIMDKIAQDKFGRLLNNTPRICIKWDAYMFCLLPIFYKTKSINNNLINRTLYIPLIFHLFVSIRFYLQISYTQTHLD